MNQPTKWDATSETCKKHVWTQPHVELVYVDGATREAKVRECIYCLTRQVKQGLVWVNQ